MDERHVPFEDQRPGAMRWLMLHARATTGRPTWSYALKQRVQRELGYFVSSGALVAAARELGFAVRGQPDRAGNAWLRLRVDSA
jgi:hypothetical protein